MAGKSDRSGVISHQPSGNTGCCCMCCKLLITYCCAVIKSFLSCECLNPCSPSGCFCICCVALPNSLGCCKWLNHFSRKSRKFLLDADDVPDPDQTQTIFSFYSCCLVIMLELEPLSLIFISFFNVCCFCHQIKKDSVLDKCIRPQSAVTETLSILNYFQYLYIQSKP